MSNKGHTVFYTGVTNDITRRSLEHKYHMIPGFTSRYNIEKLLYFEECDSRLDAIQREKQIKKRRREKKLQLIETINPTMKDLSS